MHGQQNIKIIPGVLLIDWNLKKRCTKNVSWVHYCRRTQLKGTVMLFVFQIQKIAGVSCFWSHSANIKTDTPHRSSISFLRRGGGGLTECIESLKVAYGYYRGTDKSLARPGRKKANVSVRMAWISFGALPCRKKKKLYDSLRLDVVEIARIPDVLLSLFTSWLG